MRAVRVRDDDGVVLGTTKVLKQTACGKRGYTSRKVAAAMAARARRESGEPIEWYRCSDCHLAHIGHPVGWKVAQAKAAAS